MKRVVFLNSIFSVSLILVSWIGVGCQSTSVKDEPEKDVITIPMGAQSEEDQDQTKKPPFGAPAWTREAQDITADPVDSSSPTSSASPRDDH